MKYLKTTILGLAILLGSFSCSRLNRAQNGAIIGGAGGAAAGAVIGKQFGNTAVGAILGAAVGGTAGAVIGNYMDKQAEEIEHDLEGVTVERVGEGIKLTFDSGLLFASNKSDLQPVAQQNLQKLAGILNKYPDTNVLIEGHTDSDGSEAHNQELSDRRANTVSYYLAQNNVSGSRMTTFGYGESQPIGDNSTMAGKAANRRVEVAIMANDKLKKASGN